MVATRLEETNDTWVEGSGGDGFDDDYNFEPTPEELTHFYDHVLHDLKIDEDFPATFATALADTEMLTYEFSRGKQFDPDYILYRAHDRSNIIHSLIEAVHSSEIPVARAELLTEILVKHDYRLISHQADMPKQHDSWTPKGGKNPLEYASLYPDCMGIVRAICEHGMVVHMTEEEMMRDAEMTVDSAVSLSEPEPSTWNPKSWILGHYSTASVKMTVDKQAVADDTRKVEGTAEGVPSWIVPEAPDDSATDNPPPDRFVETSGGNYICRKLLWTDLIKDNEDSCLHTAIREGNNTCAEYLLERIRLTKETESVLGCRDRDGLTLLHLAVDFEKCNEEQVKFVQLLISHYPDALELKSGEMSYGRKTAGSDHKNQSRSKVNRPGQEKQSQDASSRRVKSSAAPYKYFLESKEQALYSNNQQAEPKGSRPQLRGSRGTGKQGSFSAVGNRNRVKPITPTRKSLTKAETAAAEKMADLLKLSCMRRFGRDRPTLTELLDSQNQIHLDLNPRTRVTARLLEYIASKKLEQYLQYVYIPNLRVLDVQNKELERKGWWESSGRKDYAYIFDWLRNTLGVTKIIRVVVEDDPTDFHSDEVIEHSLKGFDVEEWKWFKWDLCIDTILEAAPNVREVNLYWSGNKAILKSWAALDGLASLRQLEKICIMRPQSKESRTRTNTVISSFEDDVKSAWKEKWKTESPPPPPPEILTKPFTSREHFAQSLSQKELEEKGKKDRWLKCTESFGKMLRKWLNHQLSERDADNKEVKLAEAKEIRVAVIDDGVNIDSDDIAENVEEGETFYDNSGHWPGYYQSSYGHGHLMACLIRDLCPRVKLYIAKLNEVWIDGRPRITPESAAEAIEWARWKKVDIISMSWTIENAEDPAKADLESAVSGASADGILLFSACDDQGNTSDHPYPAKNNEGKMFKIGSATTLGIRHKATNETFFDYIAPGSEEVRHVPDSSGLTAPGRPLFGSSIATARCAGLAAMILQCIVLVYHPDDSPKSEVRKFDNMKKMFDRMVEKQDSNSYIKVWNVFEQAMNQPGIGDDLEGNIIKTVAGEFMRMLEWKQLVTTAPRVTIEPRLPASPGCLPVRLQPFPSPRLGN